MDDLARLFLERLDQGRMPVPERADRDAAAEVQVTPAIHIVKVTALTVAQRQLKAAIGRHHISREQFANGLELVMHEGRRRWRNVFHNFFNAIKQAMFRARPAV
ncbi:MAG: hypothetical protein BWX84_01868 [Verrucomicrobia bacterium ADurb.Bin118]|nr:MAG: hypothetical protein BWX84_01868 [Verrucomicrobia bacterium ADurb.Bin118]